MKYTALFLSIILTSVTLLIGCSSKQEGPVTLKSYPISGLDGVVDPDGIEMDSVITSDGNGSFRIAAPESTTVRLYESGDINIEKSRLVYNARLRTEDLIGQAYLEMWCVFDGKGEYFSRGLNSLVSGNTDWSDATTEFYLKKGENPDSVKLNLVVNGSGTVWIDDISLQKAPLRWDEK